MNRKNLIGSFALAALFALPSLGCVVHGRAHGHISGPSVAVVEVHEEPPPPRYETYSVRPGYIWIDGYWRYNGRQYVWVGGRYERQRAGYVWAPGRWERRGRGHVWVEGRWNAGARGAVHHNNGHRGNRNGPVIRDHRRDRDDDRDNRRDNRGNGPVIRDHRR